MPFLSLMLLDNWTEFIPFSAKKNVTIFQLAHVVKYTFGQTMVEFNSKELLSSLDNDKNKFSFVCFLHMM